MSFDADEFADIYTREVGRCTATLVRVLGDVDLAEEMVADAFVAAAERWPVDGVPPNPGGWVTTTAKRRAIDRLRRESTRDRREREATMLNDPDRTPTDDPAARSNDEAVELVRDDQLRLIFLCCHPALSLDAQVALSLRLLGGLTTGEIARAFFVPEATMGQRISRAKRKIRDTAMPYRIPDPDELPRRLGPVLAMVYLVYTEGHSATTGTDLVRSDLTAEAIRLGRVLFELLPDEPEVAGLLALLLLTEARAPSRLGPDGALVRLDAQDRSAWDRELIVEGHSLVRHCIDVDRPGPYQLQAAIAAVHADAAIAADTDWAQIVELYDHLLRFRDHPIAALNRAIAVMESSGPDAALAALDDVDLPEYHLLHATRAEALERLGRIDEAAAALRTAISLASNSAEVSHLERLHVRLS